MSNWTPLRAASAAIFATILVGVAPEAGAELVLTAAGRDRGLSLTTFASGFPRLNGAGPLGIVATAGGVLVTDYPGNVRFFPTGADNQVASSVAITQDYGPRNAAGLARLGAGLYMTQQAAGGVVEINPDGTFRRRIVGGMPLATGIVADSFRNRLFVSTGAADVIWEVDPIGMTRRSFLNVDADGLAISANGVVLLVARSDGRLIGYNIATRAQIFDSGFIPGGIDGTVFGTGEFAGKIFANAKNGTLIEFDLATRVQTILATGGSRGDFLTVDPTTNSLLITQSDRILRLGAIVPEPPTIVLVGLGGVLLLIVARRPAPT